jgi:acylphosphatase
MLELELILKGQVQRVGYRHSIYKYVTETYPEVVGFVHNQPDGSVMLKVYGGLEALKNIRSYAHDGVSGATVRESSENIVPIDPENIEFSDFSILSE